MKTNFTLRSLKFAFYCLAILLQVDLQAQTPIYKFKSPILLSGTAGQVNAVYRFPNVAPGVDARVRITAKTPGITLVNIDRTLDGYSEAFQPEYTINANVAEGYFDFQIIFVHSGSTIPKYQTQVDVSGLDIDGTAYLNMNLKEFNRIDMGGGFCTYNLDHNELAISEIGTAWEARNVTGTLFGTLVDTSATQVMYSVTSFYVDTFYFRVGATNSLPVAMSRYASLYFKRFNYPNQGVLSVSNLESFNGVEQDEAIKLNWSLTDANTATEVSLEKSENGHSFSEIARYWVNMEGNRQKDFIYSDRQTAGSTSTYRLKITDASGKTGYSNLLHFRGRINQTSSLEVFPTITNSSVTINCTMQARQSASVSVFDLAGRTVKNERVNLEKGNNSFRLSGLDRLSKGNYVVVLSTEETRFSQKIIVH